MNIDYEQVARDFHECYEAFAGAYGYKTREDTKEFDPASPNGRLMIAVCKEVVGKYLNVSERTK